MPGGVDVRPDPTGGSPDGRTADPRTPGTQPRPSARIPAPGSSAPPPPRASARFPDAPPMAGRPSAGDERRDGTAPARPENADQAGPGRTPPRPESPGRPAPGRRTGAPAETAAEMTFRLRPIPANPPATDSGNRPSTASAQGSLGTPPSPGRAPAESPRRSPSAPLPPMRPAQAPSAGNGYGGSGSAGSSGAMPYEAGGQGTSAQFSPDPSLSWSAPMTSGSGRPVVSFGEPEGYDEQARPRPLGMRIRPRIAVAVACVVLGVGLIGGAVTGSWLVGEPGDDGARDTFAAAGNLWHGVPVDQLFPPTVIGKGAGPGGADRIWTRIAVAPDTGCAGAFDPLLRKALAPVGCERLLRATYTDATQSYVTTVGLLFTDADAAAMRSLDSRFTREGLDRRTDLMPRPYAAKGTPAAGFGDEQRASWTISVLTDAPVVVYAVSGWADGRTVDDPQPAEEAMDSAATTAVAQAGLGHEAQGLADRMERALRKNVGPSTEQSS